MEWLILVGFLMVMGSYVNMASRIRRIERKLDALLRHQGVDATIQYYAFSDRVKELLAADPPLRIEALKVYREETGASLREAKAAIDSFIHNM
ncbi:hypothetical protein [Leptothoe sp. PORK10 BA2]|uniref:hypothetical protein n=1 Tax=Leptothoe sp. PORK10 BA2 TaxID=3110254 RepID=UPI002B21BEB2|nr:hypothetical protein [Leptothoe sp. PORK10 BA2]MEA5467196.1 hypothetical protein [Leptothoe sp. PORK10 BA2]